MKDRIERIWCLLAKKECCNGFIIVDPKDVSQCKCPAWKNDKCSVFTLLNSFADEWFDVLKLFPKEEYATGFMNNDDG